MTKCKGCDVELVWITTAEGKNMPCETVPGCVTYPPEKLMRRSKETNIAEMFTCGFGDGLDINKYEYFRPHWGRCPKANEFRKRK